MVNANAPIAMYIIEDEMHAEHHGQFDSFNEALAELRRRATIAWDQPPNAAPCMSWQTCGREYVVIEFDDSHAPWTELRRVPVLSVSASGIRWSSGFGPEH
jgi:hypothetical protein